jgi:hypothetical protein
LRFVTVVIESATKQRFAFLQYGGLYLTKGQKSFCTSNRKIDGVNSL